MYIPIKYLEVLIVRKILLTSVFLVGIVLGIDGLESEVSARSDHIMLENDVGIQTAVPQSFLSPKNLSGKTHTYYTMTVSTNVNGVASFSFDPGISGQNVRTANGSVSRDFSQMWTTNSLTTFTTGGKVTTMDYGPAPWVYGKAVISY